MLFLVISTPAPTRPSAVVARRQEYWEWIRPLMEDGTVRHVWARVGRGAVALFDVDSNETLHRHMNAWSDIIPAEFAVYPLVDTAAAKAFLAAAEAETAV